MEVGIYVQHKDQCTGLRWQLRSNKELLCFHDFVAKGHGHILRPETITRPTVYNEPRDVHLIFKDSSVYSYTTQIYKRYIHWYNLRNC